MFVIKLLLWGITLYYLGTLVWFIKGLKKYKLPQFMLENNLSVSVIVAVRNGAKSLPKLFSDFEDQNYSGKVEYIFVDDESDDETASLIQNQTEIDNNFLYVSSKDGSEILSHKKKALDAGISKSNGDVLLFTDVDCRVKPGWISAMVSYFQNGADYVIGYSEIVSDESLVSKFQSTDISMLMYASAGCTNNKTAWASTGQNQGFTRELFDIVGGYSKIKECLQGDDSLFLQVCRKLQKPKVVFSMLSDSFVIGRTENTWRSFISQRVRWSGDARLMWKFNPVFFLSVFSTFLFNVLVLSFFLLMTINLCFIYPFWILLTMKFIAEFLLYKKGQLEFQEKVDNCNFIFWFLLQIPYIVVMGLASFWSQRISWKGRRI